MAQLLKHSALASLCRPPSTRVAPSGVTETIVLPDAPGTLPLVESQGPAAVIAADLHAVEALARADGIRQGLAEGQHQAHALHAQYLALLAALPLEVVRHQQQLESRAVELTLVVTTRLLGELAHDRPRALAAVQRVLRDVNGQSLPCVHLAPADYQFLLATGTPLADPRVVQVVADEQIAPGGCVIDMPHGSIDARLETQLAQVAIALREGVK